MKQNFQKFILLLFLPAVKKVKYLNLMQLNHSLFETAGNSIK